jgi:hypothetical protein
MNNVLFPVPVFFNESIDFSTAGLLLDLLNEVICLKKNHKQINKTVSTFFHKTYFAKTLPHLHVSSSDFIIGVHLQGGMVQLAKIYL